MRLSSTALSTCLMGIVALSSVAALAAQFCGDPDRNGTITVTDGVNVLRDAAGLASNCELDTCDVDGNGRVTVTDGVNVLRAAASLPNACEVEPSETPTPGPGEPSETPTPLATSTSEPTPSPTPPGTKRVFASSTFQTGGFGGVSSADTICAERASAAGLTGTFLAWVSDADTSPSSRFVQSSSGYTLVDGTTVVAADWNDLTDGMLAHAINRDENGNLVGGDVWTGTSAVGAAATARCSDWATSSASVTGQCGTTGQAGAAWTAFLTPSCNTPLRLYCFEQ